MLQNICTWRYPQTALTSSRSIQLPLTLSIFKNRSKKNFPFKLPFICSVCVHATNTTIRLTISHSYTSKRGQENEEGKIKQIKLKLNQSGVQDENSNKTNPIVFHSLKYLKRYKYDLSKKVDDSLIVLLHEGLADDWAGMYDFAS
jgi:hypothetical protein